MIKVDGIAIVEGGGEQVEGGDPAPEASRIELAVLLQLVRDRGDGVGLLLHRPGIARRRPDPEAYARRARLRVLRGVPVPEIGFPPKRELALRRDVAFQTRGKTGSCGEEWRASGDEDGAVMHLDDSGRDSNLSETVNAAVEMGSVDLEEERSERPLLW